MIDTSDLDGKVAIVTGSSAGLGRTIATALAREGARTVVNARSLDRLADVVEDVRAAGGAVHAVEADVRDPDHVSRLVAETDEHFGSVDILVNNAGGTYHAHAEDITPKGWEAVVGLNLTAPFLAATAVFPMMRDRGGSIVNVSSIAGLVPGPNHAHYNAAKAGLVHLTVTLAHEWGKFGIRVNCLVPGSIRTERSPFADPDTESRVAQGVPLGRVGVPEDIEAMTLVLCSDVSSFVSGAVVRIDGGPRSATSLPEDAR